MYKKYSPGWIEVITGPMFSGKTEELIKRVKVLNYAQTTMLIAKPKIDNRWVDQKITSRNGRSIDTVLISSVSELEKLVKPTHQVIVLDEVQFLEGDLSGFCRTKANQGHQMIISGLDQDYLGNTFGPIPELLALAEFVTKLTAICFVCHNAATMTYRKSKSGDLVEIGDLESYEARCRACHLKGMASKK